MTPTVAQIAREGHGAIQVEAADPLRPPLRVVMAGPIKHWWSLPDNEWGKGEHATYLTWRDAVEVAFVKAGFLVYLPHKAWRGSWHESAQMVNDQAISIADILVDLTPPGIPNDGTQEEIVWAAKMGVHVMHLPPADVEVLDATVAVMLGRHAQVHA